MSLSKMLLNLQPERSPPGVRQAAQALAVAVEQLEARSRAQGRPQSAPNPRAADVRLDRAWGAIDARLRSWGIFAVDDPDHDSATELLARLFPTGLDFLTLPYLEQHAQSERRVQIIDEEGLRDDLEALVGEVFVQELLEAHAAYGEALGITTAMEPAATPVYVVEPLRAVLAAISRYVLQVLAYADQHPDNVTRARRALSPIDAFRRSVARRSGGGAQAGQEIPEVEEVEDVEDIEPLERLESLEPGLPAGAPASDAPMSGMLG